MSINVFEILISIINFLILLFVLRFVLFKPLFATLRKRKETIAAEIQAAEDARSEMEALREDLIAERAAARQKSQEIVASATKAGEAAKETIIAEAKAEAAKIIAKSQDEIREEKERALSEIRGEAANLAIMAATKLVGRSLDDSDHRELVDSYIEKAGEIQ